MGDGGCLMFFAPWDWIVWGCCSCSCYSRKGRQEQKRAYLCFLSCTCCDVSSVIDGRSERLHTITLPEAKFASSRNVHMHMWASVPSASHVVWLCTLKIDENLLWTVHEAMRTNSTMLLSVCRELTAFSSKFDSCGTQPSHPACHDSLNHECQA